jgi:hypothetical protein
MISPYRRAERPAETEAAPGAAPQGYVAHDGAAGNDAVDDACVMPARAQAPISDARALLTILLIGVPVGLVTTLIATLLVARGWR